MTDSDKPLSDDELLSAYLDGELNDDQVAHVERLLAASAETRQLLAELRAVGDRLRAMPAEKLGDGFAERVLRRAEREMLVTPQPVAAAGTHRPLEVLRSRGARPWIYAGLTLAAGLLLMLLGPRQASRETQVAQHTAEVQLHEQSPAPAADTTLASHPHGNEPLTKFGTGSLALSPASDAAAQQPDEQMLREALDKAGLGQFASEVADRLAPDKEPSSAEPPGQDMLLIVADVDKEAAAEENLRHLLSDNSISIEDSHRVSEPQPLDRASRKSDPSGRNANDKQASEREQDEFRRSVSASVMVVDGTNLQLDAALIALDNDPGVFQNVQKLKVPAKGSAPALGKQRTKFVPPVPATPVPPAPSRSILSKAASPAAKAADDKQESPTTSAARKLATGSLPPAKPTEQTAGKLAAPPLSAPTATASKDEASARTSAAQAGAAGSFHFTPQPTASQRAIIILRSTGADKPVGPPAAAKAK